MSALQIAKKILGLDRGGPDVSSGAADDNPFVRDAPADYEVSRVKRPIPQFVGRVVIWTLVGVVLVAGLLSIGRSFVNRVATQTPVAPPASINTADASSVAGRFAADYLTYNPLNAAGGKAALSDTLISGADPTRLLWTGSGWLAADLVIPAAVTVQDTDHAVVAVRARVQIGAPASSETPVPTTPAIPLPGPAANTAALPAGYQVLGALWLSLQVPVTDVDGAIAIDAAGPVFSTTSAMPNPLKKGSTDSSTTTATRDWANTLFTAYSGAASTDMNYLTDPNSTISTLSGAVALQNVQSWSIGEAQPDGTRSGAAAIAWTLKPTADLSIVQNYSVTATSHDKRWFAAAITTSAPSTTTAG
jgi:hypothetical protein